MEGEQCENLALIEAIALRETSIVKSLLENGEDVNKLDANFNYPLLYSASLPEVNISFEIIQLLLNHPNINVNILDNDQNSILHKKIILTNDNFIQQILSKGFRQINQLNSKGETPFSLLCGLISETKQDLLHTMKLLIINGAKASIGSTIPKFAISSSHLFHNNFHLFNQIIELLMNEGADINEEYSHENSTETVLTVSLFMNDLLEYFLKKGADPNTLLFHGKKTALSLLCEKEYFDIDVNEALISCKLLIQYGAKIEIENRAIGHQICRDPSILQYLNSISIPSHNSNNNNNNDDDDNNNNNNSNNDEETEGGEELSNKMGGYDKGEIIPFDFDMEISEINIIDKKDLQKLKEIIQDILQQRVWEKDGDVKMCNCGSKFGPFTRRHHCRLCFKIFCRSCVEKVLFPSYIIKSKNKREFACSSCKEIL